jgi:DNA-binding HxlR family transcriptional regulator
MGNNKIGISQKIISEEIKYINTSELIIVYIENKKKIEIDYRMGDQSQSLMMMFT